MMLLTEPGRWQATDVAGPFSRVQISEYLHKSCFKRRVHVCMISYILHTYFLNALFFCFCLLLFGFRSLFFFSQQTSARKRVCDASGPLQDGHGHPEDAFRRRAGGAGSWKQGATKKTKKTQKNQKKKKSTRRCLL